MFVEMGKDLIIKRSIGQLKAASAVFRYLDDNRDLSVMT